MSVSRDPGYRILHFLTLGVGEEIVVFLWGRETGEKRDILKILSFLIWKRKSKLIKKGSSV